VPKGEPIEQWGYKEWVVVKVGTGKVISRKSASKVAVDWWRGDRQVVESRLAEEEESDYGSYIPTPFRAAKARDKKSRFILFKSDDGRSFFASGNVVCELAKDLPIENGKAMYRLGAGRVAKWSEQPALMKTLSSVISTKHPNTVKITAEGSAAIAEAAGKSPSAIKFNIGKDKIELVSLEYGSREGGTKQEPLDTIESKGGKPGTFFILGNKYAEILFSDKAAKSINYPNKEGSIVTTWKGRFFFLMTHRGDK
jgi:hypothetical protein